MKILGIDPGTLVTGFGIVKCENGSATRVHSGTINLPPKAALPYRLGQIYSEIDKLILKFRPDEFSIETAFYGKNVQSAMKIGYARGVSILAAVHHDLPTAEYSPREVKKSVVGRGAATKEQVQFMIKKLLALRSEKIKFDETDALAVALCHYFRSNIPGKSPGNWKTFIKDNPEKIIG